jgi:hypothetical protein
MPAKAGTHVAVGRKATTKMPTTVRKGKMVHETNLKSKISRHCLFNSEIIQITEYFMQKLLEDSSKPLKSKKPLWLHRNKQMFPEENEMKMKQEGITQDKYKTLFAGKQESKTKTKKIARGNCRMKLNA